MAEAYISQQTPLCDLDVLTFASLHMSYVDSGLATVSIRLQVSAWVSGSALPSLFGMFDHRLARQPTALEASMI